MENAAQIKVRPHIYKPYNREMIPGVNPEGNLGIGHRNFGGRVTWNDSNMKKILTYNPAGNE